MSTTLILTSKRGGKKVSETIPHVNPECANDKLELFARKLNGLSKNTFVEAERVDRQSLNEETS